MPNEIISPGFTVNCQPGVSIPVIKVSGASGLNAAVSAWILQRMNWWCGWRGSNPRPLASEANTLSTELQPHMLNFESFCIFSQIEND